MSGSGRCTCPNEAVPLSLNTHATAACTSIGFVPRSSWGLCLSVLTIKTSAISGTTEVELVEEMNN